MFMTVAFTSCHSVLRTQLEPRITAVLRYIVLHRLCYRSDPLCSQFLGQVFSAALLSESMHTLSLHVIPLFALHLVSNHRCHTILPAIPALHTISS
jgi:hypothetical protein